MIKALQRKEDGLVDGGVIVAHILRLRYLCRSLSFSFVKRAGNSTTHGLQCQFMIIWLEESPP